MILKRVIFKSILILFDKNDQMFLKLLKRIEHKFLFA